MGQQESMPEVDYDTEPHFINSHGKRIACHYWYPVTVDKTPRALVLIAHGAREHCHWYDVIAEPLTKLDVLVFAHDHVGHGKSEGDRAHIEYMSDYTQDILQHVNLMKEKFGDDIPVFIIGSSMGGTVATKTAMENPGLFQGVVLIAPAIVPSPAMLNPVKEKFGRLVAYAFPQIQIGKLSPDLSAWLCRDPAIVQRLTGHPLVWQGRFKARWCVCMLDTMLEITKSMDTIHFPFLILHGDEDVLCPVSGSELLHEMAASKDKTLKIYTGGYHQLHNEPDGVGERVIADIVSWVGERLPDAETVDGRLLQS